MDRTAARRGLPGLGRRRWDYGPGDRGDRWGHRVPRACRLTDARLNSDDAGSEREGPRTIQSSTGNVGSNGSKVGHNHTRVGHWPGNFHEPCKLRNAEMPGANECELGRITLYSPNGGGSACKGSGLFRAKARVGSYFSLHRFPLPERFSVKINSGCATAPRLVE